MKARRKLQTIGSNTISSFRNLFSLCFQKSGKCLCCCVTLPFLCPKYLIQRCCSIQVAISLIFLLSNLLLGSFIITLFQISSYNNVSSLFLQNQKSHMSKINYQVGTWLNHGSEIITMADKWLKSREKKGVIDLNFDINTEIGLKSMDSFENFLVGQLRNEFGVHNVGFGGKNGIHLSAVISADGYGVVFNNVSELPVNCTPCPYTIVDMFLGKGDVLPGPLHVHYFNETEFEFNPSYPVIPRFDSRLLPWYYTTVDNPNFQWNHQRSLYGDLTTTISRGYFDINGIYRGALTVMFIVSRSFTVFLNSLDLGGGTLFMVDANSGLIIASTDSDEEIFHTDSNGMKKRISPLESSNDLVREISEFLIEEYDSFSSFGEELEITTFESSEGELYHVVVSKLSLVGGFDILNVHYIADYLIFGEIDDANTLSISVGISMMIILSILSSCFVFCFVYIPIVQLTWQMKKVESMNLSKIWYLFSCFFEIRRLQGRFKTCVSKLKEYRAFLPNEIVEDVVCDRKIERYLSELESSNEGSSLSDEKSSNMSSNPEKNDSGGSGGSSNSNNSEKEGSSSGGSSSSRSLSSSLSRSMDTLSTYSFVKKSCKKKGKFGLRIRKGMMICLFIMITNWRDIMHSEPRNFIKIFSEFFKVVTEKTKKFGTINSFCLDRIVIHYPQENIVHSFRHMIKITMESTFSGVIGHSGLKRGCLFDGCVEKAERMVTTIWMKYRLLNRGIPSKSLMFFDSNIERRVSQMSQFKFNQGGMNYSPFDIVHFSDYSYHPKTSELMIIYELRVDKEKPIKSQEWMYELAAKMEQKRKAYTLKLFSNLLKGENEKAKRMIKKFKKIEGGVDGGSSENSSGPEDEDEAGAEISISANLSQTNRRSSEKQDLVFRIDFSKLENATKAIIDGDVRSFRELLERNSEEWDKISVCFYDNSVLSSIEEKMEEYEDYVR